MPAPLTITVSENAAKHVRDFTQKRENEVVSLRVLVHATEVHSMNSVQGAHGGFSQTGRPGS